MGVWGFRGLGFRVCKPCILKDLNNIFGLQAIGDGFIPQGSKNSYLRIFGPKGLVLEVFWAILSLRDRV